MGEHEPYQPSLTRLASLATSRPSLMSSLMKLYREREGMDDEQLAAFLECDPGALPRLALCRRPRQAPDFRGDIEAIAAHTGADPSRLAKMVRAAEVQEALSGDGGDGAAGGPSVLMAARDHDGTAAEEGDTSHSGEATEDDSP